MPASAKWELKCTWKIAACTPVTCTKREAEQSLREPWIIFGKQPDTVTSLYHRRKWQGGRKCSKKSWTLPLLCKKKKKKKAVNCFPLADWVDMPSDGKLLILVTPYYQKSHEMIKEENHNGYIYIEGWTSQKHCTLIKISGRLQ